MLLLCNHSASDLLSGRIGSNKIGHVPPMSILVPTFDRTYGTVTFLREQNPASKEYPT